MKEVGSVGSIRDGSDRLGTLTRQRIPARPTVYKGIRMRSRMEADFARVMDNSGVDWEYEPVCFADQTGQYLPDFRMTFQRADGGSRRVYVELKPYIDGPEEVASYKRRMEIVWSSEPDAQLLLVDMESLDTWSGPSYSGKARSGWREIWPERRSNERDEIADPFGAMP